MVGNDEEIIPRCYVPNGKRYESTYPLPFVP
jgi:hypothetical protein